MLFFGAARELAGTDRAVVGVKNDARLSDLVAKLEKQHGAALAAFLRQPPQGFVIMVNGRDSNRIGGFDAPLSDRDTVAWLPVIFGG